MHCIELIKLAVAKKNSSHILASHDIWCTGSATWLPHHLPSAWRKFHQVLACSGRMLVVRDAPNTSPNSGATGRFTASLAAHLETEFTHAVTGQPSDWNANVSTQQQQKTRQLWPVMASSSWKSWNPKVKLGVHDRMFYDVHAASTCSTDGTWWHNSRASPWRPLACAACFRRLRRATASVLQHQAECRRQVTTQSFIQRTMAPWSGGLELASWFKPSVIQVLRKFQPY